MSGATTAAMPTRAAVGYTLGLMFLLNTMNYVDRLLFGVTQELIKGELQLSDFQLGLLGGPAFAILYTLAAFPIARYAERGNRVAIISVSFATWSALTAFCGMATSFTQMLIARAGVSIGESGCTPPSHSLISDYFPPERRTTAMSVFASAGPVGALVASLVGGWIAQHYGWRTTFFACGAFGLATAMLFRLTIREPRRTHRQQLPPYFSTLKLLLAKRSYALVGAAGAFAGLASFSNHQYMVSFLMRAHDMSISTAATVLGLVIGAAGAVVTLLSGPIIDRGRKRFPRIRTWLPAAGLLWCGFVFPAAFMTDSTPIAIALLVAASLGQHFYIPAVFTVAQDVAPPQMRATAAAMMIALIVLLGYGLGPPVTGLLSDAFGSAAMAAHGTDPATCARGISAACEVAKADGLRLSLSIGSIAWVIAALLFALSGRTIERDMHR